MSYKSAGFTLVETLVVMIIIGFVMIAASGLASTVLTTSSVNQSRVQAIYLAQECTELVRNVRDSAWRQNFDWKCPFKVLSTDREPTVYDPTTQPDVFTIKTRHVPQSGSLSNCQNQLGTEIERVGAPEQALLADTEFQRYFTVDDYDAGQEALTITCHVAWPRGQVDLTQRLTNWRQP